jgi:hypothetical protein
MTYLVHTKDIKYLYDKIGTDLPNAVYEEVSKLLRTLNELLEIEESTLRTLIAIANAIYFGDSENKEKTLQNLNVFD